MKTPYGSPVVLHVEFDGGFLKAMLDRFGVEAWNRWLVAMADCIPSSWGEGEDEPPACLWFDVEAVDLSGRNLDGIDLGLVRCEGATFEGAHAVGSLFACVKQANFRHSDIRESVFIEDVSGADFTGARMDGVSLADATYDADCPPVGLPAELLGTCRAEHADGPPDGESAVVGLVEYPVHVKTSIAASATI